MLGGAAKMAAPHAVAQGRDPPAADKMAAFHAVARERASPIRSRNTQVRGL